MEAASGSFAAIAALIADPMTFPLLILAVIAGLFFGLVPGLGGKIGIVISITFVGALDTNHALIFLIAMHAVVHTGGSVPSILFGIPGTGPDAATVLDGHPLARQGEAARALGASLFASGLGGITGALFLAALLPLIAKIVGFVGPAEFFLLAALGIVFISSVSGSKLRAGLIVGLLGLLTALVGMDPHAGEPRFAFGQLFLWSGVDIVTALMGIFAVPEILALAARRYPAGRAAKQSDYTLSGVVQGMRDVIRHRWLALRTSIIGAVVGLVPGLGGDAASWICYGHAVQSSSSPERFGKGAIEGVIAPETANNSKEGGALLPTLFFGVPGSSGMALLIGALVALGIQPGPQILHNQPQLVWQLIAALVMANILAVIVLLLLAPRISLVVDIPRWLLVPCVFVLILTGVYLSSFAWQNFALLAVFGLLGYLLKRHDWPRAPFAIGLVLGRPAELSFNQAMTIWGWEFFLRPVSIILLSIIVATIAYHTLRNRQRDA